jgi:hypothetical protein
VTVDHGDTPGLGVGHDGPVLMLKNPDLRIPDRGKIVFTLKNNPRGGETATEALP